MNWSKYFAFAFLLIGTIILTSCRDEPTPTPAVLTEPPMETAPASTMTPVIVTASPTAIPSPTAARVTQTEILGDLTAISGAAPKLIGRSPAAGAELRLDQPLELYFDQPMDRAKTAASFQMVDDAGETISGDIDWPQPRIMTFTPAEQLEPNRQYDLILTEEASSEEGIAVIEGLTIPLTTIGDLEITQVSPAAHAVDMLADSAITVIFNRPVVPLLIAEEQADLPNPLVIEPTAQGIGEWINTSVFVFRPTVPLIGRETYTVRVDADIINAVSATGSQLASDYEWSFSIMPPTINRLSLPGQSDYPRDGFQHMELDQSFQVYFNQPMDVATTESAITVSSAQDTVPLAYEWNELRTSVVFTPTRLLELGSRYVVSVTDTAESRFGGRLRNGLTWSATTVLPPAIVRTQPSNGATQNEFSSMFRLDFASRMDSKTLAGKVIFDPPTSGDPDGQYDAWSWGMRFWGLQPSTTYTVTILPGMADRYGNTIDEPQTIRFTTAAYTPSAALQMHNQFAMYRQGGSTAMWVAYRNAQQLDLNVYGLTLQQWVQVVDNYNERDYLPPSATPIISRREDVSAEINVRGYKRFDLLDSNQDDLSPGLYFVSLNGPGIPKFSNRHVDARPLIIATANLTLKTTATEVMAWVTDLESGAPLSGVPVTLYDDNFREVVSGSTDQDGLFYQDGLQLKVGWQGRYYAVTESDDIFAVALSYWSEGVNPYDFGINTDYYLQPGEINTYIYTDRPLYRPGQTVYFKGIMRVNDDLHYTLPVDERIEVKIYSFEGEVYSEQIDVDEFGTFAGELLLDDEAVLGGYRMEITRPEQRDQWLGSGFFDVAEFRKPTFQVTVTPDQPNVLNGDTVRLVVDADFFSGGSVANGEVFWNLTSTDTTFNPGGPLRPFSFNTQELDRGYYYYDPFFSSFGQTIASGTGITDGKGQLLIEVPAELVEENSTKRFVLEATVTDIAGNAVSGRANVTVHPSQLYGGIRPSRRVATAEKETNLELVVVDWDGETQANAPVRVEIVERRWYSVQEEDENGRIIWRSSVEEIPVATIDDVVTDSNGRADVPFTPASGGIYRAYAVVTDRLGNEARTSTYFWVAGPGYIPWRRVSDHSFELIADADDYRPGDTAEILIASPFQGEAQALVTVERGHIYQREVVRLTSNSTIYQLPITGDMAPNIFVSVVIIKGVDETNPAPDFKVGMLRFNVEREEQELQIEIVPDREVLGPRDTVSYQLRVRDHAGNPVEADLSLSLVDLALLGLKEPNAPPILDFFYSTRWLSVQTSLLLTREMDSYNQEIQEEIKGGGGGGGDLGVISVRENFKDTAYWNANIRTDVNGEATVSVELPDNLTTWRLDVRAITKETLVGQATADVMTTRPLLVSPQTPRFFIVGDEAIVGTSVRNTTNQPLEAQVSLQASGVVVHDDLEQRIAIEPNGQALVTWSVTVEDVSRTDFVFTAVSGDYQDASRPTLGTLDGQGIPVYKYEVPETVGTSGQLLEGGIAVESIGLPIFPDYVPTEGEVTIEVAPSLSAAMTDGLDYLEHYSYECTEQVVSKFLPNVVSLQALRAAGIEDSALEANLETQINVALQKLYSRQRSNGGWPWWDTARTNTLVSAYVLLGMHEAQQAGYPVRQSSIDRGLSYLRSNIDNVDGMNGRFKLNRQAFIVYVLAELGDQPTNLINDLFDERQQMDLYARAFLAEAMMLLNETDPRIETIAGDFMSAAIVSATGTHWEENQRRHDYWNWNTDTRSTGIIMGTMAKIDPTNPLVANSVRWLMSHRTDGRWHGTQETAFVLMGLTDWMIESGELEADYEFEVALNGNLLGGGTANASTLRTSTELKTDITTLLTDQLNQLAIGRTDGDGNLYYTAHMEINIPVAEVEALDRGIIISRSYYDPDDRQSPIQQAVQGDTVLAKLTIVVPNTVHYVVIDDFLPAGLEAIDTSLLTSQQQGEANQFEGGGRVNDAGDFYRRGWGWWYFDHVQLRDEKVEISADYLPPGTYEYVYLARASTVGVFNVIPPTAQEFYFPEVYGRGDGLRFTVHPRGTILEEPQEEAVLGEPIRISFDPGAIAADVEGQLRENETVTYLLQAAAGQTMTVAVLSPRSDVGFAVTGVTDGQLLGQATAGAPTWSGKLPSDQDYAIELRPVGAPTSYLLSVTIDYE